jgi:ADP-ribose pyrophosphatase YjhB (NUDIX family)
VLYLVRIQGGNMREQRLFYCYLCGGLLEKRSGVPERWWCTRCRAVSYENPVAGVAGVIFDRRGRLLMVRRGPTVDYAGLWCIPCGYVEYEEDVRDAVAREVREETGLTVRVGEVLAVHSNFHNPRQHTVGIWFLCARLSGRLRAGDDADEAGWFWPQDPPPLAFPTDALVLAKISKQRSGAHD